MIIIGSFAAMLNGINLRTVFQDLDLIGSEAELTQFRNDNANHIVAEEAHHEHRIHFTLRGAGGIKKLEFDIEQSPSDLLLEGLATQRHKILNSEVSYPGPNALYLIKRAHANNPVGFEKTVEDMLLLKPHTSEFTSGETTFYKARKKECQDRFAASRQRFYLSISNEDFFALSNHIRSYVHDDVHEAVAHDKGNPIYKRCKRDLTKAKIHTDLFEMMDLADRRRMVQEEFMVIGVERNYVADRTLDAREVYRRGMMKTVKDLFVGYFQDFCLDNFDALQEPPPFDFLKRFDDGVASGEIHPVPKSAPPPGAAHKKAWALIKEGKREEARVVAEDLARRSDPPGDPHALHILGAIFARTERKDLAERYLRESLSIFEQNAAALTKLGTVLRLKGEPADALTNLRRAAALNPNRADTQVELGLTLEGLKDREGARKAYAAALRIHPGLPVAVQRLAGMTGGAPSAPERVPSRGA